MFSRRADGVAIATLSPDEGLTVHSLVEGATDAEDLHLGLIPTADEEDEVTIWNDEGDLVVSGD